MNEQGPTKAHARTLFLPTTFGGVAALAKGPTRWLIAWQVALALGAAVVVVWAVDLTWGRAIAQAVDSLPEQGRLRQGTLEWSAPAPAILYQGSFLSLVVDPDGGRDLALSADVTLSVERHRLGVNSLFGWFDLPYSPHLDLSLGRLDMVGWIDAWKGPALLVLGTSVFLGLLLAWAALASVYAAFFWPVAWLLNRALTFAEAWRLAAASLLPGAFLLTAALALYATRQLGWVGLLLAVPGHFLVGWIYCAGGLGRALRRPPGPVNPFAPETPAALRNPRAAANPFQAS